jgi:hypothetical protein
MRVRLERRIKREMESQLELNLNRLRRMRDGLKKMLTEIKRRYRRGEIKEEDFLRLKTTYERRIKEVDRVLNRQRERTKSVRA